jgi:hypothetical protein
MIAKVDVKSDSLTLHCLVCCNDTNVKISALCIHGDDLNNIALGTCASCGSFMGCLAREAALTTDHPSPKLGRALAKYLAAAGKFGGRAPTKEQKDRLLAYSEDLVRDSDALGSEMAGIVEGHCRAFETASADKAARIAAATPEAIRAQEAEGKARAAAEERQSKRDATERQNLDLDESRRTLAVIQRLRGLVDTAAGKRLNLDSQGVADAERFAQTADYAAAREKVQGLLGRLDPKNNNAKPAVPAP